MVIHATSQRVLKQPIAARAAADLSNETFNQIMDTSPLEQKIASIEAEIADKEQRVYLLKVGIKADKTALKGYKEALAEIKGQEK